MNTRSTDGANRKRAKYIGGTIGLILKHQAKGLGQDAPFAFMSTVGQLRFIRSMLFKAARK
jgi:hypothetical protein